jgi:DNA repair protein RecN (Recombination protein N)
VETHVGILDEFGGLLGIREEFERRFIEFDRLSEEARKLREEKERKLKERDLLAFQSREIETSGVQTGEEEAEKRKISPCPQTDGVRRV